jgi:hypothetical protein
MLTCVMRWWRAISPLIPALELPDPEDRHVLAAAIHCGADLILTFNLDDFPEHSLASYGIGACHPDPFLVDQLNLDAERVCIAMRQHRASLCSALAKASSTTSSPHQRL